MDTFEYAVMRLVLGEAILDEGLLGKEKTRRLYKPLSVRVIFYYVEDDGSLGEKVEEVDLDDRVYQEQRKDCGLEITGYRITPAQALSALAPQMARLGKQGWEVVEHKFSTFDLIFSQALLKRRITGRLGLKR